MGNTQTIVYRGREINTHDRFSAESVQSFIFSKDDDTVFDPDIKPTVVDMMTRWKTGDDENAVEAEYERIWDKLPVVYRNPLYMSSRISRIVYAKECPVSRISVEYTNAGRVVRPLNNKRPINALKFVLCFEPTNELWAFWSLIYVTEPTVRLRNTIKVPRMMLCANCHLLFSSAELSDVCEECDQGPRSVVEQRSKQYDLSFKTTETQRCTARWNFDICLGHLRLERLVTPEPHNVRPRRKGSKITFETCDFGLVTGLVPISVRLDTEPDHRRRLHALCSYKEAQTPDVQMRIDLLTDDGYRLHYFSDRLMIVETMTGQFMPAIELTVTLPVATAECNVCGKLFYHRRWRTCHGCRCNSSHFAADPEDADRPVYMLDLVPNITD